MSETAIVYAIIGIMVVLFVSNRVPVGLVALAAASSFLTPISSTVNMMVQGPGGYRFGDYWKLGLPLMAWFFVAALLLVPAFWPFNIPVPR